ncbi:MAG: hypothetical protein AB1641_15270 [Thermodesulfobacteriota bacterium]
MYFIRRDDLNSRRPEPLNRVVILLFPVLLTLAGWIVYHQVRDADFIIYDDGIYVLDNAQVQRGLTLDNLAWSLTANRAHNWHPLTWLSLMLDHELFGLDPGWFHLTNLLLHLAGTLVLLSALYHLTGEYWPGALTAGLFLLHPLNVESVAWVAQRKTVLCGLFIMLTLLAYSHYVRRPSPGTYLPVFIGTALALMAKPMAVTLPVLLLLLDYWPLGRLGKASTGRAKASGLAGKSLAGLILEKIPLVILAAVSSWLTLWAQTRGGAYSALASFEHLPPGLRLLNAVLSYFTYMVKTFWPADLIVFYPHPGANLPPIPAVLAGIGLGLITWLAWRARSRPYLIVGWLWFLVSLAPMIGLIQVSDQAQADRYAYLPLIGLFIMAAWGLKDLAQGRAGRRAVAVLASILILVGLAVLSSNQVRPWRDTKALFIYTLEKSPDNYLAHLCLGIYYKLERRLDLSVSHLKEAVRLQPGYAAARQHLGYALILKGAVEPGLDQLRAALRLNPGSLEVRQVLEQVQAGRIKNRAP